MATLVVYSELSDGYIESYYTTYTPARQGTGNINAADTSTSFAMGQSYSSPNYFCYEAFLNFDTSILPDAATVTAVTLRLYGSSSDTDDPADLYARIYDWGDSLTTGDWHYITFGTLVATHEDIDSDWNYIGGYNDFVSEAGFPAAVSKTGKTRICITSNNFEDNTAPTGEEYVQAYSANRAGASSLDPRLIITYTADLPLPEYQVGDDVTANYATSATPALPTHAADDLLWVAVMRNSTASFDSTPSGWTELGTKTIASTYTLSVWYMVADSDSESDPAFTWTGSCKVTALTGGYRGGFDAADPIDVSSSVTYETSDTTIRGGTVTTSANNESLLFIGGVYSTSDPVIAEPSGFIMNDGAGSTTPDCWIAFCQGFAVSQGATGNQDGSMSPTTSNKHAFLIALNPEMELDSASGEAALQPIEVSAAGTVIESGSGSPALQPLEATGAGTVTESGAGTATLQPLEVNAAGTVIQPQVTGSGSATLPAFEVTGGGSVDMGIAGWSELIVFRISASGSGWVTQPPVDGSATVQIGPLEVVAYGWSGEPLSTGIPVGERQVAYTATERNRSSLVVISRTPVHIVALRDSDVAVGSRSKAFAGAPNPRSDEDAGARLVIHSVVGRDKDHSVGDRAKTLSTANERSTSIAVPSRNKTYSVGGSRR